MRSSYLVSNVLKFWDELAAEYQRRQERAGPSPLKSLTEIGIGVTSLNVVLGYWNSQYGSAFVCLLATASLLVVNYLRLWEREDRAKWLLIGTFNITLFLVCYFAGLKTGTYLYFFPVIFAIIFLIDSRISQELIMIEGLTMLCLALTFVVSPYEISKADPSAYSYHYTFRINLALSLVLTGFVGYSILKTLNKKEADLLSEKAFRDTIFDTSLDGIFIIDLEKGEGMDCNQRALALFALEDKERFCGRPVEEMLGEEFKDKLMLLERAPKANPRPWFGNLEFALHNGQPLYAYTNIVPFEHLGRSYAKVSILDITQVRIAEVETLKAKEKAEKAAKVKSRFLSSMSHELRTPLNAIIGSTNLLLEEPHLQGQKPMLDVLKHSSSHMLELVNDVLDYSKLEAEKMELGSTPFSLEHAFEKVYQMFRSSLIAKGLGFEKQVDPRLNITVIGDELRLSQVLNNLLSNALKFTDQGIVVLKADLVHVSKGIAEVEISITDTGIGIPKEKQNRIFDKFYQTDAKTTRKYGGSGLGLAISKYLVKLMGGEMAVESEPGQGSTFSFRIKLDVEYSSKPAADSQVVEVAPLASLEGIRVLVAEDNPVNMMVVRRFLQKWQVQLYEATNGKEAVQLFGEHAVDIALLDLDMPEMDGETALRLIREINPEMPVIAFTAAVYDHMQNDLEKKGFTDFLPKPFRPEELRQKICAYLKARQSAA
ncbi:ATP-binding protein [Flavihumibacter rivuli]|uniref:ATP-binding protein n=1 Tax=Flavihumibacter rivuli TaxID=2838156 RepID=UPI001BDF4B54|nr:ATP-binding protein [Flavihumibacter rivuli]ULQ56642.1 ATP-binding protein [Flavihumibacter rivuli]